MAHQTRLDVFYEFSLMKNSYKHLRLDERTTVEPSHNLLGEGLRKSSEPQINFRQMPPLEKLPENPPSFSNLNQMSYNKVHPKKKMRMTYDKQQADAHNRKRNLENSANRRIPTTFGDARSTNSTSTREETSFQSVTEPANINYVQHSSSEHEMALPELIPLEHGPSLSSRSTSLAFNPMANPYSSNANLTSRERDKELNFDLPQDLRVCPKNERLKHVTKNILTAPTIPQINPMDIPRHVFKYVFPEHRETLPSPSYHGTSGSHNKRIPGESSRTPGGPRDVPSSPVCDSNCSSSYFSSYSPTYINQQVVQGHQLDCSPKEPSYSEKVYQPNPNFEMREKEFSPHYSHSSEKAAEDPVAYLRKPIEDWSCADVVFFLVEACKELRINPEEVDFKNSDDGLALQRMNPCDFEALAPSKGQSLYEYFTNFRNRHIAALDHRNTHYSYNYNNNYEAPINYSPHLESPYGYEQHPTTNDLMYSPLHYSNQFDPEIDGSPHFNHIERSPSYSSHAVDSPLNEYTPQNHPLLNQNIPEEAEFLQNKTFEMPSSARKTYEMPSAARKSFPPLHNNEEPVSDPDDNEDIPLKAEKKRGPGRPPKPESERKRKTKKTGRLWEFIRNLLLDPKTCPSLIKWEDAHEGVFRIVQSDTIANKWGMRKSNTKMNYEKLSRAMRYYYKAKIFEPVFGKRLVYKFGSCAQGWRPLNIHNPNFNQY